MALQPFGTIALRHSLTSQAAGNRWNSAVRASNHAAVTSLRTLQLPQLTRQLSAVLSVQLAHRIVNLTGFLVK